MEAQNTKKWYNKMWVVILMSLTLFPISLFVIWKNKSLKLSSKIGLSLISPFSTLVIIATAAFLYILILSKLSDSNNKEISEESLKTSSPSMKYLTLAPENNYFNRRYCY